MAKMITIQGSNEADEKRRLQALEKLNENLSTVALERVGELCESQKAQSYFENSILYQTVKAFLKK